MLKIKNNYKIVVNQCQTSSSSYEALLSIEAIVVSVAIDKAPLK